VSWMRRLDFGADSWVPGDVLRTISVNSSNWVLCPGLRELEWMARSSTMHFHRLFLSPHLTAFWFLFPFLVDQVPGGVLLYLTLMVMELPTSSLTCGGVGFDGSEARRFLHCHLMRTLPHHAVRVSVIVECSTQIHHATSQTLHIAGGEWAA